MSGDPELHQGCKFYLKIWSGSQLDNADVGGLSDPYVLFKFGNVRYRTEVKEDTLNPCWDEFVEESKGKKLLLSAFPFDVLAFDVHDKDVMCDDKIGYTVLPWSSIVRAEKFADPSKGDAHEHASGDPEAPVAVTGEKSLEDAIRMDLEDFTQAGLSPQVFVRKLELKYSNYGFITIILYIVEKNVVLSDASAAQERRKVAKEAQALYDHPDATKLREKNMKRRKEQRRKEGPKFAKVTKGKSFAVL